MNKFKKYFLTFLLIILIIILFKYNYILQTSVLSGVALWLHNVFPSLFIMFILNDLIINLDLLNGLNKLINPLFNKIFKTTGNSSNVFLLSLISGTPSSAFILKEMIRENKIGIKDANKLIAFTYFSNPLFLYNILSLSFNKYITFKIIIIHYITNFFIGLFFRTKGENDNNFSFSPYKTSQNNNLFIILPKSIKKSLDTLIMILGTIVFYMIITNLIIEIIPLNNIFEIIIKGIIEITQSLKLIPNLNYLSIIKEIIALSIISFGGLSIHTQVLSIISDTKIIYKNFLIGRILHILISISIYILLYII